MPDQSIVTEKDRASTQDMENWDESFDFQPIPSDKRGTTSTSMSPPATLAMRHKAYSVSTPPNTDHQQTIPISNSLPTKHENWDDSYVYEDDEDGDGDGDGDDDEEEADRDDISSLSHTRPPPVPLALISRRTTKNVEDDVESWGSNSDWSGDGDAEDSTRGTFKDGDADADDTLSSIGAASNINNDVEKQPPASAVPAGATKLSGIPRFGRFAAVRRPSTSVSSTNATSTKSDASNTSSSAASFLSKISPVHRWKSPVRDDPTPKRSQPFQVNRDKMNSANTNTHNESSHAGSKDLKKGRVEKKDMTRKGSAAPVNQDNAKKRNSKIISIPNSQSQQQQQQQRNDKDSREKDQAKTKEREKVKDRGAVNAAMSPIKRVFSGTPLSPKNSNTSFTSASAASGFISSPPHASSSYSQASSQSSVALSAGATATATATAGTDMGDDHHYERELRDRVAAVLPQSSNATTTIRRNPPSAPASTMTSPTSTVKGQGVAPSGGIGGTRTKVRYRSKTTTGASTGARPNIHAHSSALAPAPVLGPPFKVSSTERVGAGAVPTTSAPVSGHANGNAKPPSLVVHRSLSQTPRRSSLNDLKLKIPERISHAQRDIKRDMSDVKEFAACVEQIRNLQHIYAVMLRDLRAALSDSTTEETEHTISQPQNPPRADSTTTTTTSTSLFNLSPKKRRGTVASTTPRISPHPSPQPSPSKADILKRKFSLAAPPPPPQGPQPSPYAVVLNKLDNTYGIWWECAEVLMELGGSWKNASPVSAGSGRSSTSVGIVDVGGDTVTVNGVDALGIGIIAGRRMRAVTLGSDVGSTSAVAVVGANVINSVPSSSTSSSQTIVRGEASESNLSSQPRTQTPTQTTPSPRLSGPPQASPPKPSQWRATTGRAGNGRDLTSRQLAILQDMIMGDEERNGQIWDPKLLDPEKGGGGGGSLVESVGADGGSNVKRRGLRDFWSGLRKGSASVNGDDASRSNPTTTSTSVTSTDTSTGMNSPTRDSNSFDSSASASEPQDASRSKKDQQRKTRHDVNSSPGANRPRSPRTPSPSKRTVTAATAATTATVSAGANGLPRGKKPLHRPSLAGLFGIGQKGGIVTASSSSPTGIYRKDKAGDGGSSSDWDWDLMEAVAFDDSTTSVKKPTRRDTFSETRVGNKWTVQLSDRFPPGAVYDSSSSTSPDKKKYSHLHSQIEEDSEAGGSSFTSKKPSLQLLRAPHVFLSSDEDPLGKGGKVNASNLRIHSDVLHKRDRDPGSAGGVPVTKLALTPENIRPLLKRAREIAAHLNDCIGEVRGMMGGVAVI